MFLIWNSYFSHSKFGCHCLSGTRHKKVRNFCFCKLFQYHSSGHFFYLYCWVQNSGDNSLRFLDDKADTVFGVSVCPFPIVLPSCLLRLVETCLIKHNIIFVCFMEFRFQSKIPTLRHKGNSTTASNASLLGTPDCQQNPKWPPWGPKMAIDYWTLR